MEVQSPLVTRKAIRAGLMLPLVAIAFAVCAPRPLPAQTPPEGDQQQQKFGETIVTADTIDYDFGSKQVVATGSVELLSGTSRLTADKMTVQMTPGRTLEWAKCDGKVFVERKNPENGNHITARARLLEYFEVDQKANLQGDVVAHFASERLAKPAVLTGGRIDMDLKTQKNVAHKSDSAQAKIHVEPKGEEGKKTPEPLDLIADKIEMDGPGQTYTATGSPALVRPSSRLTARVIRFQVDEKTKDVKKAFAEKDVVFNGTGENGQVIHTTADNGEFDREQNLMVLTGMVQASVKEPGEERPTIYQGQKFTYNTVTRASRISGGGRVVLPQNKLEPGKPGEEKPKSDKPATPEKKP